MSKPVPKPRTHKPAKQEVSPTPCSTSVALEKKPPPVPPKTHRPVRTDGQPGMARSISLPETEHVYQNLKRENTVLRSAEGSLTLQTLSEAINSNSQTIVMERQIVTERVIVTQRSLDEPFQRRLALKHLETTKKLPDYKTNSSTPWKSFSRCISEPEPAKCEQLSEHMSYKPVPVPQPEFSSFCHADEDLMEWWRTVKPWEELSNDHYLLTKKAPIEFAEKARRVKKAFLLYEYLLSDRGSILQNLILELLEISDNLNKVFKGSKIAGITGGAAGAAGVAAAVGGVLLAPLTMGASLAVAAVGVGVAAAGGVTGASAAITNKVNTTMDRKKVEKILQDYMAQMEDIERCVEFINTGVEHLKSYNLSKLHGVDREAVKMARVAKVAWGTVGAISAISKSSGLIQGFSVSLDIYFTKKDKEKLKRGSEAKFAKQIRQVAEQMQANLDELMKVKVELELEDI